ncbi:MAG TPA: DUF971 domain-containing protein [Aestuariivirgaceae bacterium]|jgi:DUF971 family protein
MTNEALPWPRELRLRDGGRLLDVQFDSGEAYALSAELLRTHSPSAEVKGHGPGQEVLVTGKQNVRIRDIEPVGNYAVRLLFDDGHATGLYSWPYLLHLGRKRELLWARYLERVAAHGSAAR